LNDAAEIIQQGLKDVHDKLQLEAEEQNLKLIEDSIAALKGHQKLLISEMERLLFEFRSEIRIFRDEIQDKVDKGKIEIDNKVKESLQMIGNKAEIKREDYDDLKNGNCYYYLFLE
jgi:hypothetical protein